jgi:hypothetical protein
MPKLVITDLVSIYSFKRTGNTEAYDTTASYTKLNACISPTGTDIQTSGDVPAFQLFEIFIYDVTVDIKNGDKIINQSGLEYIVDGKPYVINNQYLQYIRCLGRQVT